MDEKADSITPRPALGDLSIEEILQKLQPSTPFISVSEPVSEIIEVTPVPVQPKEAKKAKESSQNPAVPEFKIPSELFEKKGRIFCVIYQKGGCGKTTTTINLGAGLALEGLDVLLIDLDAQANTTLGVGVRLTPEERNVYHLFKESIFKESNPALADLIRPTTVEHLSVLPASRLLAQLAIELPEERDWEYRLRNHLRTIKDSYHYILIDCPPALNALTVNALTAADEVIIPLQTHYFSLEGMKELFLTIHSVQERLNPLLRSGRILPTLFDRRAKVNRQMLQSIRDYFKEQVLDAVIHTNVRLVESSMQGEPVFSYDAKSRGAEDYRALTHELITKDALIFSENDQQVLRKFF